MNESKQTEFLEIIKRNLMITWEDSDTDETLKNFILNAASYLNEKAGYDLTFEIGSVEAELLVERVRYAYNNALDDFEKNFSSQLSAFILNCALSIMPEGDSDGSN